MFLKFECGCTTDSRVSHNGEGNLYILVICIQCFLIIIIYSIKTRAGQTDPLSAGLAEDEMFLEEHQEDDADITGLYENTCHEAASAATAPPPSVTLSDLQDYEIYLETTDKNHRSSCHRCGNMRKRSIKCKVVSI